MSNLKSDNKSRIEIERHQDILSSDASTGSPDNLMDDSGETLGKTHQDNVPNVNIPERIILCLDVCYNKRNALFKLGDGTSFTAINMTKRVIDFFLHSKSAINNYTEFALMILKDSEAVWIQDFTTNVYEIVNKIDLLNTEECTSEEFDLKSIFNLLNSKITLPEHSPSHKINPPANVYRLLLFYARSTCVPKFITDCDTYNLMKNNLYFYIDILLSHEEDCAQHNCEEIYYALQDLDNGYSYVFQVSTDATKIHDCTAKLLAHPLQRPLQKNNNYAFAVTSP